MRSLLKSVESSPNWLFRYLATSSRTGTGWRKPFGRLLSLSWSTVFRHVFVPALACLFLVWLVTWIRGSLPLVRPLAGLIFSAASLFGFYFLLLLLGQRWMEPTPRELFSRFKDFCGRSGFSF